MLNTYKLITFLRDKINNELEEPLKVELLNSKDDLAKVGNRTKIFLQYAGIDYTDLESGSGEVKLVFYVASRRVYNNKDDNIPIVLDRLRSIIYNLDVEIEQKYDFGYLADYPLFREEKYNNTDTMEFIYSLVIGIPILV